MAECDSRINDFWFLSSLPCIEKSFQLSAAIQMFLALVELYLWKPLLDEVFVKQLWLKL